MSEPLAVLLSVFDVAMTIVAVPLFAAGMVLLVQVVLALLPAGARPVFAGARPRVAVLVPAHDESSGLLPTLAQAGAQLAPGDRLLVVADNCSDDTAEVARGAGAEVIERFDTAMRGKGYALDHGVRHLASNPPEVVVVLDADCTIAPGSLALLARTSHATGRPVQARYLMHAPAQTLKMRVAEFAMRLKNWVRPRGMHRAGLPCGLYGTGMAFPWAVAERAPFASGHLAEDMQLGIRLAELGTPPLFCEQAEVESVFAASLEGEKSQRTRWEHGHLSLLVGEGPRLLWSAVRRGRWALAWQTVDMLIPPLALLLALQCAHVLCSAVLWWSGGSGLATGLALTGLAALVLAILLARARFAADVIGVRDLLGVPRYVLGKLSIYGAFVARRQVEWIRTRRDGR